ncbi:DUF5010 domain-containing protein [Polyangium mundeleinium]|uniref:DUF5010 domain-containing protein n=1 Tax=Polyangium mundeleinium TaxID=2995306 RepID=A0ABT5EFQ2_9BACT|nr:DUF5010 domain-containing protein [Polyangium mundeleinium]MDC0740657.1 DUF5010 domain-containing protein [Polyangium mundeleinium]
MRSSVLLRSSALVMALVSGCGRGSYDPTDHLRPTPPPKALPENVDFELREEFDGPCAARTTIDVNLGNTPESFVRAAHCQIHGVEPSAELITSWAEQLRTREWVRRIDVVRSLCSGAGKSCPLTYSDPWKEQVLLTTPCVRKTPRDVGAVLMFFSECPGGVNCDLDWANTHASGMDAPHRLHAFGAAAEGYYHPDNAGFWKRELLDARWAGLQFLLVNTYGPDLGRLGRLSEALADVDGGIQIALFDDTWSWGRPQQPPPWNVPPNLTDADGAAQVIYQAKWKPFFDAIAPEHWYRVEDRPFIYFYNAGTLKPLTAAAAVVARLKQLFAADFGVEPFVAVDRAFFQDPGMPAVADSQFLWDTFGDEDSHSDLKGVTHDHFMVKWDSLGRDHPGDLATDNDRLVKGPELLQEALGSSAASDLAVFATWNDLGEGTGIHRNYDYYHQGQWLTPHAFMSLLRAAQCEE